jgi:cytochrome P450
MDVFVSQQSIHSNPNIWGADVEKFKPTRWLDNSGNIITPPKGTFIPWSGGPRVCPGMKMSQVEFVAAMAVLFRSGRCEPVTEGDMSLEQSRKTLHGVLYRDSISKVTLQVKHPTKVKLAWYQEISR